MEPTIRDAVLGDSAGLFNVVHDAYRGSGGWTTEHDLLTGYRISLEEVENTIKKGETLIVVAEDPMTKKILGCIELEPHREDNSCKLGLFAVLPNLQGGGIGSKIISAAETIAKNRFQAKICILNVFTVRQELVDYYRRRGYVPTNKIETFFPNAFETCLVPNLQFVELVKVL
eukprot:TRINITY_DN4463_c0_g1_i2.p1 TRINITY_DN4463_c0_g1~~TRINITY_DN4463_c0_g1_i2.p1  ORF type:complete len:173 (+),score=26.25 TRINITY_DN4463_c0_g1_i2:140-658(+)